MPLLDDLKPALDQLAASVGTVPHAECLIEAFTKVVAEVESVHARLDAHEKRLAAALATADAPVPPVGG